MGCTIQGSTKPIPVAERSKASVRGPPLAGVAGSNTAGGMDVCDVQQKTKGKARTIQTNGEY